MKGARGLITAAMIIAGMRLWMQIRGKTKTPFGEWAIGWGALFLLLSLFSEVSPGGAGMLALTVTVGDVLANGTGLFNDVTGAITGAEKGQGVLSATPFSGSGVTGNASSTSSGSTPSSPSSGRSAGLTRNPATLAPAHGGTF